MQYLKKTAIYFPAEKLNIIFNTYSSNMQNRRRSLSTAALLSGAVGFSFIPSNRGKKYILHNVFFWLKNPGSKPDAEQLVEGLKTLRQIEVVKQLHIGLPATTEQRDVVDASFDVSELMFFETVEDQKAYQDHPIHKKFVENCSHLWEKVVVYDSAEV